MRVKDNGTAREPSIKRNILNNKDFLRVLRVSAVNNGVSGFTLIEMLVAMVIFSALIGVLMSGFSQGLSLWERSRKQTDHWQGLELRVELLQRLFEQASASDFPVKNSGFLPWFEGSSATMRFLSTAPVMSVSGTVKPVQLRFERKEGKWRLLYREGRRGNDPGRGMKLNKQAWTPLLTGLQNGSFRYEAPVYHMPAEIEARLLSRRERARYRENPVWMDSYNTRNLWILPQRIEIHFTDAKGVAHRWRFFFRHHTDVWSLEYYYG